MLFALDTNVVVAALKHDLRARSRLLKLAPNEIILPTPTLESWFTVRADQQNESTT